MTDTPNTKPSEAIQRYITLGGPGDMDPHEEGDYVRHRDHLAALARAREEARREALQDAKFAAEATGRVVTDGLARLGRYEQGYARARADIEYAIHSLLTPTPQRESRVDQKRPPHPEEIVNALQDRVHPASGPLIQSKPVTPTPNTSRPSEAIQRYELYCEATTTGFFIGPEVTEDGRFVMHSDALAWVARAREEARREALEEVLCLMYERDDLPWSESLAIAIRALAVPTPTPQGETKEND